MIPLMGRHLRCLALLCTTLICTVSFVIGLPLGNMSAFADTGNGVNVRDTLYTVNLSLVSLLRSTKYISSKR